MNKKLLKSIVCIGFGVGVASSIPFTTTSCGSSSSEEIISLPKEVYHITPEGVLTGFETEFLNNMDKYSNCNTMLIPDEVITIGEGAFYIDDEKSFPTYITNLTFSESSKIISIGKDAFCECSSLTSVSFPDSLQSIGMSAFYNCTSITSIFFPSSVTEIGDNAFFLCSLETITFPQDNNGMYGLATNLGTEAFAVVKKTTDGYIWSNENGVVASLSCGKISLPEDLTQIGEKAFYGCSGITDISLPSTLAFIGKYAFSGCNYLKTIDLSNCNNLETISKSSFNFSHSLTSISLPESIKIIQDGAFYDCSSLKLINLSTCKNLETIDDVVFSDCSSLDSIVLPNSLTTIKYGSFRSCTSLSTISFPSSLITIGGAAFSGCRSLNKITWDVPDNYSETVSILNGAFSMISKTGKVKSLNPSITSQKLLEFLQTKGLPAAWTTE